MSDVNAIYVQQAQEAADAAELAANNASAMYTEIVEHDLPSIQASKDAIRTAIAGKGADIDASVPFSEYANKIDSIGADATATAADVLTGKTFLGANGNETGSMPVVTPVLSNGTLTVAKGAVTEEYTKNSVYDTSDVSTSTSNVRSGYPFYTKNGKQTGTAAVVTPSLSNGTLTVEKGFVDNKYTKSNVYDTSDAGMSPDQAAAGSVFYNANGRQEGTLYSQYLSEPSISVSSDGFISASVTTYKGIYSDNNATGYQQLPTTGGQSIMPSTMDQTIDAGYYITSLIRILGDSNLIAENIKEGVTIFGVTGTHRGEMSSSSSSSSSSDSSSTGGDVVFTVSGITSPADANGGYVMTDTTSQGKPVYKHESKEYYIFRPPSYGNVWVLWGSLGDISPGDAYFYSMNDSVEGTWENSSAGSGTMVVTMGAGGGGSSDVVFTLSGSSNSAVNGDYTQTPETAGKTGKEAAYTNGDYYVWWSSKFTMWYCSTEVGNTVSAPVSGLYGESYDNPWDESAWSNGVTCTKAGTGGEGEGEGEGEGDVVFTFSGSSNSAVNGDFVQTPETAGQTGKNASYTNGNVYVWYASSFNCWFCTNVLGDATSGPPLHASNGTGDDPWSTEGGWNGVTCTKAGSGGGGGEESGPTKFTISGCYTVSDINTTYTLTSGSGKSAVYTAENGCTVVTENNSWVVKHPMGGNILFAYDDSYSPITNVDNPWEISMWYDNDAGSRYTITFSDVVIGGGGGSEAGDIVFSVTGFSGSAEGANGDYWQTADTAGKTETYAVYTNGSYYFFHNNPGDQYAYWYVGPKAGDTGNAVAFCSSMMKMNPWEGTYYDTLDMMGGYNLTFTMGGSGGSGDDSSDIPANGFKVTGVTSPASLNGVYSLTSGDISNLSSCQWTNENGGHLKYFSGGYWIFGDSTNPANTPGDCFYYGTGIDKKPWEITSWGDGSYTHSGTLVLTAGGTSAGGDIVFTVEGIMCNEDANGDYWCMNPDEESVVLKVYTNGKTYCSSDSKLEIATMGIPSFDFGVKWYIYTGTSADDCADVCATTVNKTEYSPWEADWQDAEYGSSVTVTRASTKDYTTFTVSGIVSYGELNGTYNRTSGSGKNAVYTISGGGTCSYNAGLSQWQFSSAAGSVAIAATADAENPWDVERWWDDNTMSEPTITFSNMA